MKLFISHKLMGHKAAHTSTLTNVTKRPTFCTNVTKTINFESKIMNTVNTHELQL
jgi:hypothetical protein